MKAFLPKTDHSRSPRLHTLPAVFTRVHERHSAPANRRPTRVFADDTALYLSGSNFRIITPRLQKAIDELTRWFQTWRIEVNPEKSAAIFFNYSRVKRKKLYHTTHQHSA
ncbi:hypothetical protein EVAR_85405_1 [Eumeta japonica]|uniref:Uncharacterized protein n=1 Tax=Eumeta variegata TaxID=151549 RepID=A0A4C1WM56_EUMVA|nr:hypothetical protein EVAR_85405_1 [Eumeta japonica]